MKDIINREQRAAVQYFKQVDFLVKARFNMQLSQMDTNNGRYLPELNEIVYITDDDATYMLIVSLGHQQYLMNEKGEFCSDAYDSIIQLFNKTPHAEAFIVERNHRFGVLNKKGKIIIPCVNTNIELLKRVQIKGFEEYMCVDSEVVSFFVCEDENGQYALYSHDGQMVFHGAAYIMPGEEHIKHSYEFYTHEHLQVRKLETLFVYMSVRIDKKNYRRKYVYKLSEDEQQDHITFIFLKSDGDKEVIERPPVPCTVPHAEDPYPGLFLNRGYGQPLCTYIRRLLTDKAVYAFVVPEQIHWDQITHLKRLAHSMTSNVPINKVEQRNLLYPQRCFTDVIEDLERLEILFKQ